MSYTFQPRLVISSFCLLLIIVFSALGIWQLQRAEQKQLLLSELDRIANLPASSLNQEVSKLVPATKVTAQGHYLAEEQFFLDNIDIDR